MYLIGPKSISDHSVNNMNVMGLSKCIGFIGLFHKTNIFSILVLHYRICRLDEKYCLTCKHFTRRRMLWTV